MIRCLWYPWNVNEKKEVEKRNQSPHAKTRPSWDEETLIAIYLLYSVAVLLLVCPFLGAQCGGKNIGQINNKNKIVSAFDVENG